jgi:trehalose-phosphatase
MEGVIGRVARAPSLVVGLDYDGTLTPIVEQPDDAVLGPAVRRALQRLAGRPRVAVAVVSGRRRADVAGRVGLPEVIAAGNHGLDIRGPGMRFIEPTAWALRPALAVLAADLRRALRDLPGVVVEDKGLTVSVHYRRAAPGDVPAVGAVVEAALRGHRGSFRLTPGHCVFEVRPLVDWHKGRALRWIVEHCGLPSPLVIYVGDDETDEDAFRDFTDGVTVRVGNAAGTAAGFTADGPGTVVGFLDRLANTPLLEARPT